MYLRPTAQGIVPVCNVDKPVGANRNLKPANGFPLNLLCVEIGYIALTVKSSKCV